MNNKKKKVILFIYPTYLCSGNCSFCFIDAKLRKKSNDLSLEEIKNNISYFEKKYLINQLALVGGDPLLYKDIIPLMDFLEVNYFRNSKIRNFVLCTEGLKCSSAKFADYLSKFFAFNIPKLNSCIDISLNNFYPEDRFFEQKKQAIINLAERGINIRFIIVFVKGNVKKIRDIPEFLNIIFSKYYSNSADSNSIIDLRLPFNLKGRKNELFVSHPDYFFEAFDNISNSLFEKNIPFTLRNIPLCYLKTKNIKILNKINKIYKETGIKIYKKANIDKKIIRIDKNHQLNKAIVRSYSNKRWGTQEECSSCVLKNRCNGIIKTYIKKFRYPKLKPFNKDLIK